MATPQQNSDNALLSFDETGVVQGKCFQQYYDEHELTRFSLVTVEYRKIFDAWKEGKIFDWHEIVMQISRRFDLPLEQAVLQELVHREKMVLREKCNYEEVAEMQACAQRPRRFSDDEVIGVGNVQAIIEEFNSTSDSAGDEDFIQIVYDFGDEDPELYNGPWDHPTFETVDDWSFLGIDFDTHEENKENVNECSVMEQVRLLGMLQAHMYKYGTIENTVRRVQEAIWVDDRDFKYCKCLDCIHRFCVANELFRDEYNQSYNEVLMAPVSDIETSSESSSSSDEYMSDSSDDDFWQGPPPRPPQVLVDDDDWAEMQGDTEQNLEDSSETSKAGNITFVDEREVIKDEAQLSGPKFGKDDHGDVADTEWTIKDVLTRECLIYSFTWDSSFMGELYSMPNALLRKEHCNMIQSQLKFFAFARFGIKIRVQVNGTKFHCGRLIVALLPPLTENRPIMPLANYTMVPHSFLDASISNSVTLVMPFIHILSQFPQREGSLKNETIMQLGELSISPFNALRVSSGASQALTVNIYCSLVAPELHHPTVPIETLGYTTKFVSSLVSQTHEYAQSIGKKRAEEDVKYVDMQGLVGLEGLVKSGAQAVGRLTGDIVSGGLESAGKMLGLVQDKPLLPLPAPPVVNRSQAPLCHGAGVDMCTRLALSNVSQKTHSPAVLGTKMPDFDLKKLITQYCRLEKTTWATSQNAGTELFKIPVCPTYVYTVLGRDHISTYYPTALAYNSRPFTYWRGKIDYKLQIIATQFHSGRLAIVYNAAEHAEFPKLNLECKMNHNVVVVDLQEKQEIEVSAPFMSAKPFLRCDHFRTNTDFSGDDDYAEYLNQSISGVVSVFVLTPLVAPNNVSPTIDINLFVRAGDDFTLAVPAPLTNLTLTTGLAKVLTNSYAAIYPFVKENKIEINIPFREHIDHLYFQGKRLVESGHMHKLKDFPDKWYCWGPAQRLSPSAITGPEFEEPFIWKYRVRLLHDLAGSRPDDFKTMCGYVDSLPNYVAPKAETEVASGIEIQGKEDDQAYVTSRKQNPGPVSLIKGYKTKDATANTLSENAMKLETVMKRYYPIVSSPNIYHTGDICGVTIPISPTFSQPEPFVAPLSSKRNFLMHPIQYFTAQYTFWSGGFRYRILYDNADRVVVVHNPRDVYGYQVRRAVERMEVHNLMTFASDVAVAHTQSSVDVEVGYFSPYNQLFVDISGEYLENIFCNGTLHVYFFRSPKLQKEDTPLKFQIFMSVAEDFMLNLIKPTPAISTLNYATERNDAGGQWIAGDPEGRTSSNDIGRNVECLGHCGFEWLDLDADAGLGSANNPIIRDLFCQPEPGQGNDDESGLEMQALFETPKVVTQISSAMEAVGGLTTQLSSMLTQGQLDTHLLSQSLQDSLHNTMQTVNDTAQTVNQVSGRVEHLLNQVPSLSNTDWTYQKYIDLSINVTLLWVTGKNFITVIQEPTVQSLVNAGMSFCALLGYQYRDTLASCLNIVASWAIKYNPLAQAQASDGPFADLIESAESKIIPILAVFGTVIYAFLFDIVPKFWEIKKLIKKFFESEPDEKKILKKQAKEKISAQGISLTDHLKNAHFATLGFKAISSVYTKMLEYATMFIDWLLDRENPAIQLARAAEAERDEILALTAELDELDNELILTESLTDVDVHNRFYRLRDRVDVLMKKAFTKENGKHTMDPRISAVVLSLRQRVIKLIKQIEEEYIAENWRYDPFCVCLCGPPGTGKTSLMAHVAYAIQDALDLPRYNLIYNKTVTKDGFWNGYKNQTLCCWDEFGQNVEADQSVAEFINLRGNAPCKISMAAIEDKKRWFTSKAIILTTNVPFERFNNTLRCGEAVLRRRHKVIRVNFRAGVNAAAFEDRIADGDFSDLEFAILNRITGDVEGNGLTYEEMINACANHARRWDEKQKGLQRVFHEMSVDRVMPRGVIFAEPEGGILDEEQQEELDQVFVEMQEEEDYVSASEAESDDDGDIEAQGLLRRTKGYSDLTCIVNPNYQFADEAERISAELFVIESESMTQKVLRKYRQAKEVVAESRVMTYIKEVFNTVSSQIAQWFREHPKIMALSGALIALGTMGALYFSTQKEVEGSYDSEPLKISRRTVVAEGGSYDSGPQKVARRTVLAEGTYESGPQKISRRIVEAQGCEDPCGIDIQKVVHPYVTPISWDKEVDHWRKMHALEIGGSIILAPAHFFAGAREGEKFLLHSHEPPLEIRFSKESMARKGDKDWVLYDTGSRKEPRKKLIKYFVKEEHLSRVNKSLGVLLRTDFDKPLALYGEIDAIRSFKYHDTALGDTYSQSGWTVRMPTAKGDCGAPLLALSPNLPPPCRICGIHVAGKPAETKGYSVLIVQEHVQELWDELVAKRDQVIGLPIDKLVNVTQGLEKARMIPEGDYSLYGTMPDRYAPIQPSKSSLMPTPFKEEMEKYFECGKQPARLVKAVGSDESPLAKALTKYGKKSIPIEKEFMVALEHYAEQEFEQFVHHQGRRIFSEQEAINGIPGIDGLDRINMKSSPGWPYQVLNKSEGGKFYLFDEEGNVKDPELRKRLDSRLKHAERGERVPSIWRDCLKDELRPNYKVEANKTRLFTIAPVDFTILVRQYFMDFVAAFNKSFHDTWVAVGMDPESLDWTEMYNYLAEYGEDAMATDYCGFDGNVHPEFIELFGKLVNKWYDRTTSGLSEEQKEKARRVRDTLINEIIHTMQLVSNVVYATHHGNPSGNPLTTVLNTCVSRWYQFYAWWKTTHRPLLDKAKHVRDKYYGDDIVSVVKDCPEFNQLTIKEALKNIGVEITLDVKDVETTTPYVPLMSCTFLKRGFRRDPKFGQMWMLPTMSKTTIESFYFWYRKGEQRNEQLYDNCRVALWFASFHGEEYYNKIEKGWRTAFESMQERLQPFSACFSEWVDLFQFKSGMYEKGHAQAKSEEMEESLSTMDVFMKGTNSKTARIAFGMVQAPIYYACAMLGIMSDKTKEREITDDRWAVAIPSGEGKSYLAKKYPHLFVDHDQFLLDKMGPANIRDGLPWQSRNAVKYDTPFEDKRILLVHHPNNTKRRLVGSFITHFPSFIRVNCFQRLQYPARKVIRMSREERNNYLVEIAHELEPTLTANTLP